MGLKGTVDHYGAAKMPESITFTRSPDNTLEVMSFIGPVPKCELCGGSGEYEGEFGPIGCNECNSRLIPLIDFSGKRITIDWGETVTRMSDGLHVGPVTLFVVSDGDYSDWCLLGVYSSKEKAEEAKSLFESLNDITEIELDWIPKYPPGLLLFNVVMNTDGSCRSMQRPRPASIHGNPEWQPCCFRTSLEKTSSVSFEIWAKDEQHARKIANEKRVALIVSHRWGLNYQEFQNLTDKTIQTNP